MTSLGVFVYIYAQKMLSHSEAQLGALKQAKCENTVDPAAFSGYHWGKQYGANFPICCEHCL